VTAQLWREPAGRSIPRRRKLWMCDCRLWIDEWSVRASDQSWTNAKFDKNKREREIYFNVMSGTFTLLLLTYLLLLLLHDLYSANFENRVRGAGVARWRTWLTGEGEKVRFRWRLKEPIEGECLMLNRMEFQAVGAVLKGKVPYSYVRFRDRSWLRY